MTQSVNVDTPLSQVQAWIDYAQSNNVWLVLVFHQIDTSGSIYSSTPDTLQGIVNYIQKTGIEALPMREALGKL
jgi:predicted transcriptional regulator